MITFKEKNKCFASPVRLATLPGKNTRPTVVITKDWSIFIGNERAEDMTVDPFPLFGFGLGDFEEMVCEGWGLGGFTRTKL